MLNGQTGRFQPGGLDEVGSFLADHVGRRHGVSARDRGHDRAVDHPELGNTVHHQLRVDHGVPVVLRTHLAGARLVVHLHGQSFHATAPVLVRAVLQVPAARHGAHVQSGSQFLEGRRLVVEIYDHFYAFHDAVQVVRVVEEISADHGFRVRVGVSQPDL